MRGTGRPNGGRTLRSGDRLTGRESEELSSDTRSMGSAARRAGAAGREGGMGSGEGSSGSPVATLLRPVMTRPRLMFGLRRFRCAAPWLTLGRK